MNKNSISFENKEQNNIVNIDKNCFIEFRFNWLENTIMSIIDRIKNDELLQTLKKDPITSQFLNMRIKEIVQENFNSSNESFIENISQKYDLLKNELKQEKEKIIVFIS